jgi:hypothetical protein
LKGCVSKMEQKLFKNNSAFNTIILAGIIQKIVNEKGGVDFYLRRYLNKKGSAVNFVDVPCSYVFFDTGSGKDKTDKIVQGAEILVSGHFESKQFNENDVKTRQNAIMIDDLECFTSEEELKKLREFNKKVSVENESKDIKNGVFLYSCDEADGSYMKINIYTNETIDFFDNEEEVLADIEKDKAEKNKLKEEKKKEKVNKSAKS